VAAVPRPVTARLFTADRAVGGFRGYGVLTPAGGRTMGYIFETDKARSRMGLPSILFLGTQKKCREEMHLRWTPRTWHEGRW
jgi:hypothetical protein